MMVLQQKVLNLTNGRHSVISDRSVSELKNRSKLVFLGKTSLHELVAFIYDKLGAIDDLPSS